MLGAEQAQELAYPKKQKATAVYKAKINEGQGNNKMILLLSNILKPSHP